MCRRSLSLSNKKSVLGNSWVLIHSLLTIQNLDGVHRVMIERGIKYVELPLSLQERHFLLKTVSIANLRQLGRDSTVLAKAASEGTPSLCLPAEEVLLRDDTLQKRRRQLCKIGSRLQAPVRSTCDMDSKRSLDVAESKLDHRHLQRFLDHTQSVGRTPRIPEDGFP